MDKSAHGGSFGAIGGKIIQKSLCVNHSKIIVRKPSKDICGLCYQFHLGDRTKALSSTPSTRNHDSSIQSEDDDDNDGDDEDY